MFDSISLKIKNTGILYLNACWSEWSVSVYVKLCYSVKSAVSELDHSMITSLSLERDLCGCYSKDLDHRCEVTLYSWYPSALEDNDKLCHRSVSDMTVACSYMAGHHF